MKDPWLSFALALHQRALDQMQTAGATHRREYAKLMHTALDHLDSQQVRAAWAAVARVDPGHALRAWSATDRSMFYQEGHR